jgi:AcrR family transcriptional regulator
MNAADPEGEIGSRREMVLTPWGDSESLRERRLHPGPGTSPEDVANNQRERIYGAMVAAVSTLGYEATRVADVVEISGVSSRSFYNHFANKEECFVATLKVMTKATAAAMTAASDGDVTFEERLHRASKGFTDLVLAMPAAASFVISDGYAAGPAAWKTLDRSMGAIEELARVRYGETRERAGTPDGLIAAQIGAVQEIVRSRLRDGNAAGLTEAIPELMDLLQAYRPPPEALRLSTRSPSFGPESTDSHDDADRVLRAFALVVAERGYGGVTIAEVARRGAMSPTTFYANFRDKEDALLGAIDSTMAQMTTAATTAFGRNTDWASGIRGAIGSMLNFLASRPAMAHLLTVDIFSGGAGAMRRREEGMWQIKGLLAGGHLAAPKAPKVTVEAILGGVMTLIRKRILENGPDALPALAPVCTYFALAPFLGAAEATAAANGHGRGRPPASESRPNVGLMTQPVKWTMMALLAHRPISAATLADELGAEPEQVNEYLRELEAGGLVEPIAPERPDRVVEWTTGSDFRPVEMDEWNAMSLPEREQNADLVLRGTATDLAESATAGILNRRFDIHFSRIRVALDEQGWKELSQMHLATTKGTQRIQLESVKRMRESGEKPIYGSSNQTLFEMPDADPMTVLPPRDAPSRPATPDP